MKVILRIKFYLITIWWKQIVGEDFDTFSDSINCDKQL